MIVRRSRNGSSGLSMGGTRCGALGRRRELIHHRAMRNIDEAQAALRIRSRGGQRRHGANHRIEERHGDARAHHAAQECASWQVFPSDE